VNADPDPVRCGQTTMPDGVWKQTFAMEGGTGQAQ
jgi:hypothetical protein